MKIYDTEHFTCIGYIFFPKPGFDNFPYRAGLAKRWKIVYNI